MRLTTPLTSNDLPLYLAVAAGLFSRNSRTIWPIGVSPSLLLAGAIKVAVAAGGLVGALVAVADDAMGGTLVGGAAGVLLGPAVPVAAGAGAISVGAGAGCAGAPPQALRANISITAINCKRRFIDSSGYF